MKTALCGYTSFATHMIKLMRYATLLLVILLIAGGLSAQTDDKWTLERAVSHALTNNLQVRQLDNTEELDRAKAAPLEASVAGTSGTSLSLSAAG